MSTGLITGPEENLATLTTHSATFQELVDVGTPEAARAHVYIPGLPGDVSAIRAARPFVMIDTGESFTIEYDAADDFDAQGELFWHLEAAIPEAHRADTAVAWNAADRWFKGQLQAIVREMLAAAWSEGILAVTGVRLLYGPWRSAKEHRATRGDYYEFGARIQWGGPA